MRRAPGRTPSDQRFEALVTMHADVVWRFAMGMLRNRADSDDVTQETFLRAYRGLDAFRGESSERTWLLSICRNLCVDHVRRHRASAGLEEVEHAVHLHAQTDHAEDVAVRTMLEAGLAELPADEREAFVLVDVLGFTGAEAAQVCGIPATTLRSRRQRAHERLVAMVREGAV